MDSTSGPNRRTVAATAAAGAFGLAASAAPGTAAPAPSAATEGDNPIRPFHIDVPKETLTDLLRRIAATRWPERETVAAVTVFPGEIYRAPRSWAEQCFHKLIYWNEVDKGGHFAACEEPELFASEIRAAFKSLRSSI